MPDAAPRRAERLLPCLGWLPGYRRDWIAPDLVAGATLWALVVPEALAYAAIAGVPVQYGLYAVPLALVGYFAFGSSRDLFVGPSSAVAAISASGVAAVAGAGADPERIIALTAVLSLLAGALYVVLGLLRTGWVARFFAAPVLTGFIVGLGLYVVIGQLPKLVGIPKPDGNTLQVLLDWLRSIADWSAWSVGVGLVCLAALLLAERLMPRLPAALAVAAIAILVTSASGLEDQVAVVGPIPTGFSFVPWSSVSADDVWGLLPGAAALVVVGFAESIAVAKALAVGHGREVDADRELVGYGAANLGAGVLQGYSVCGSLSKSAAAEKAGGRTPVLLLVTAGLVLLTILFLAGVFEQLPEPTLAAIVINAVWGMIGRRPQLRAPDPAHRPPAHRGPRPRPGERELHRRRPASGGGGGPGRPRRAHRRADRVLERRHRRGAAARADGRTPHAPAHPGPRPAARQPDRRDGRRRHPRGARRLRAPGHDPGHRPGGPGSPRVHAPRRAPRRDRRRPRRRAGARRRPARQRRDPLIGAVSGALVALGVESVGDMVDMPEALTFTPTRHPCVPGPRPAPGGGRRAGPGGRRGRPRARRQRPDHGDPGARPRGGPPAGRRPQRLLRTGGPPRRRRRPPVVIPSRRREDDLALAVTEIRQHGGGSVQVVRRLQALLLRLRDEVLPEHRAAVDQELARLRATVLERLGPSADLDRALAPDPQGLGGPARVTT